MIEGALAELRGQPAAGLSEDRDVLAGFEQDATGRFSGRAAAVCRPRDTAAVAAILAACERHRAPLVPQGGNTGLVGGGVPSDGELVLSLRGLDWIGEVDRDALQLDVGAGATLAAVQAAATAAGLELPIDHGARDSATIGGMVATNAGGPLALRHGSMRARVTGLELVLPGGAVVRRMAGLLKDNAGYDLPQLLVGSEGTLGVVAASRLRLEPAPRFRLVALLGVADLEAALVVLRALRSVSGLEAVDFLDGAGLELVRERRRLQAPLPQAHPYYLVVQCAAADDVTAELAAALDPLSPPPEVVAATDTAGRQGLWAYRDGMNEAIRAVGVPHKLDVALPIAALPRFEQLLRQRLTAVAPAADLYLYGHLGDGNVHVNVLGLPGDEENVDRLVLEAATGLGGTISAEHGIGRAKRQYLHLCRSPADIAAMRALKRALDPHELLSPGRVLPDP